MVDYALMNQFLYEGNAAEVRGDAREGRQRRADPARRPFADRRVRDRQSAEAADQRRDPAHLDARLERVDVRVMEEQTDVVDRPAAVHALECARHHVPGRQEQEEERVREERHGHDPRQ